MLELITANQRLAEMARKVSIVVGGRAKVGKTSLLLTLPADDTLALDAEAGLKSIEGRWDGNSVPVRSWPDALNIACLLAGPDPARSDNESFSGAHYAYCTKEFGGIVDPAKYRTIFVDSITDITRIAMWSVNRLASYIYLLSQEDLKFGVARLCPRQHAGAGPGIAAEGAARGGLHPCVLGEGLRDQGHPPAACPADEVD